MLNVQLRSYTALCCHLGVVLGKQLLAQRNVLLLSLLLRHSRIDNFLPLLVFGLGLYEVSHILVSQWENFHKILWGRSSFSYQTYEVESDMTRRTIAD